LVLFRQCSSPNSCVRSHRSHAIDVHVEMSRPGRDTDEDPRWWILRKETHIDRVHRRKFSRPTCNRSCTLQHSPATSPLSRDRVSSVPNELGLAFNWSVNDFSRSWIERRKSRHINRIAMSRDSRRRRSPPFQIGGQRFDANDL
jgi:hypothetical protein